MLEKCSKFCPHLGSQENSTIVIISLKSVATAYMASLSRTMNSRISAGSSVLFDCVVVSRKNKKSVLVKRVIVTISYCIQKFR